MGAVIFICDGLGDRPATRHGHRTPLQAAHKPNFDRFATEGVGGIMDIIAPGIRPGSDVAHLSLLGYDPYEVYTGRGPIEAAGVGLELKPGDIAFRCNFATVDSNKALIDRRAGRIKKGTTQLARSLNMDLMDTQIICKEGTEHRAVLVLRGSGLSAAVSDVDPHRDHVPVGAAVPLEPTKEARHTADVLNAFVDQAHKILGNHEVNAQRVREGKPPANIILPRGAGVTPQIEPLSSKYGLRAACVAGVGMVKGVCTLAGMDVLDVEGATGGLDTDIGAKVKAMNKALDTYDLVLVNVKAPDLCGHDHDFEGKVKVIERIDGALRDALPQDRWIALTADHSTPVDVGDHTGDPVPLVIRGPGVRTDNVVRYDECSLATGGLGRIRGRDLMLILLDLMGVAKKFGA